MVAKQYLHNWQTPSKMQPQQQQTISPVLQRTQFRLHHTYCSLQRLCLTLQWPMACPAGLATHTLAGLCALWLPSGASSTEKLQKQQNRNPPKPPAQPCRSPQCRFCHTSSKLQCLYLTLQYPMACPWMATHTLAGLWALCFLLFWKSPYTIKSVSPTNHLPSPAAAPSKGPTTPVAYCRDCI